MDNDIKSHGPAAVKDDAEEAFNERVIRFWNDNVLNMRLGRITMLEMVMQAARLGASLQREADMRHKKTEIQYSSLYSDGEIVTIELELPEGVDPDDIKIFAIRDLEQGAEMRHEQTELQYSSLYSDGEIVSIELELPEGVDPDDIKLFVIKD